MAQIDVAVTFEWFSGEPLSYQNWFTGEPNNNLGNEDYVHMFAPTVSATGQWNDLDNISVTPPSPPNRFHSLLEAMLASVVCVMLQGARGYSSITQWIHDQDAELWHALGFPRWPPKLGAFRKLLMALSPNHFEQVLADWAKHCLGVSSKELLEAVALDGKTLCGTLQTHERAVHLLSLLDQRTGCVLSQSRVDAKTNEHKGALELLKTLVLEGRVITGDAMFCQREVWQEIRDRGGHYFRFFGEFSG